MRLERIAAGLVAMGVACSALAYGTPATLKAELTEGNDLSFAAEASELSAFSNLSNAVFAPTRKEGEKLPALVIFHSCSGIKAHIRDWTEAALKAGYVVLVPDAMRGLRSDCGSPPQIPNARLIKDALDGVGHLAKLSYVDGSRISVLGFSKGAFVATWLASSTVANTLRPGTPPIASTISVYGFCGLAPNPRRPQGVTLLQPDTDRPHLMLMGGRDNETPPDSCLEQLPKLKATGAPVQWHLYPEATHAWDARDLDGFTKIAYNNQRVTYIYDRAVTEDSMKRVFDFLSKLGR